MFTYLKEKKNDLLMFIKIYKQQQIHNLISQIISSYEFIYDILKIPINNK